MNHTYSIETIRGEHNDVHFTQKQTTAVESWLASDCIPFADYYDPNFAGFSALRVINDDADRTQAGFGTHPHKYHGNF